MADTSNPPLVGSENPSWTRPVIQNNTDSTLTKVECRNRSGRGRAPEKIQANRTEEFKHVSDNNGSFGGVAYQVDDGKGKWIIAWKNVSNINNKVYTNILEAGDKIDWDNIFDNLLSSNTKDADYRKFLASVVIDLTSGSPTITAVLKSRP